MTDPAAEEQCAEALAILLEEEEICGLLMLIPPDFQPTVEQALVVAFWVGHVKATQDRLAEIERLEAEAIRRMGH